MEKILLFILTIDVVSLLATYILLLYYFIIIQANGLHAVLNLIIIIMKIHD